jgi:hypothetical protein
MPSVDDALLAVEQLTLTYRGASKPALLDVSSLISKQGLRAYPNNSGGWGILGEGCALPQTLSCCSDRHLFFNRYFTALAAL